MKEEEIVRERLKAQEEIEKMKRKQTLGIIDNSDDDYEY